MTDKNTLGLYLHIPFCEKKCAYCDFFSGVSSDAMLDRYTDKLIEEITEWGGKLNRPTIDTVYFGGGTPSLLGKRIEAIINEVKASFSISDNTEITLELNPSGNTEEMLLYAKKSGVNRISIGAQSGDDKTLSLLGRTHTAEQTVNTVIKAREIGFNNISLDLIIGLPHSNIDKLKKDLDFILSVKPEHISAYILKIEENTLFYKKKDALNLPTEDDIAEQYLYMCRYLEKMGYTHYEISNFCICGNQSRHNLKYWNCREYLGIGPSAHSFLNGKRFYYPRNMADFLKGNSPLPDGDGGDREEYIMLRLRLKDGLIYKEYENRFNESFPESIKKAAQSLEKANLIYMDENRISLTDNGMIISNSIITHLLEEI